MLIITVNEKNWPRPPAAVYLVFNRHAPQHRPMVKLHCVRSDINKSAVYLFKAINIRNTGPEASKWRSWRTSYQLKKIGRIEALTKLACRHVAKQQSYPKPVSSTKAKYLCNMLK